MEVITLKYFLGLVMWANSLVVIDIFKFKNINNVMIFHCDDKEIILLQKAYQRRNIKIQAIDISRNTSYEMPESKFKVGIVMNTSCNLWEGAFHDVNKYKHQYSWILYTEELSSTIDSLHHYHIEIDSNVMVVVKNEKKYQIYEVFNTGINSGRHFRIVNVGYWNSSLHITSPKRSDLRGVVLRYILVVTENIEHETFEHFVESSALGRFEVDTVHKFKFFTMLKYIRDMYNFSYHLQRTNSWGYVRNGSFDGLVGALQWGGADVGATGVFIRADRARVIDYVAEIWPTKSLPHETSHRTTFHVFGIHYRPQFILRQPKFPGGFYSIYTGPLASSVWYCVLGTLLLIAVSMVLVLKQKVIMAADDEDDNEWTLAFLFVFGAVSQQGILINRSSNSIKMIIFVTFILMMCLYQFYNALILSALLKEPPRTIKTLNDLLQSKLQAGVEDVAYNKDFFKRTTDPIAKELYKKKIVIGSQRNYLKPEVGLSLVKKGGFAYLVDAPVAYNYMQKRFTETEICEAQEVPLYPPQSMGIVVRKGLPYKEHFAYAVRKMLESGVMARLRALWDAARPPCVRTPDASVFSVSVYEFSTALTLLLCGVVASVFILLCEIIVDRKRTRLFAFQH